MLPISQETYWHELKRRGVLSPEFDVETEQQRLLDELPGDGVDTLDINGNPIPKPGDPPAPPVPPKPAVKPAGSAT